MPTAAKLVSAIYMAIAGVVVMMVVLSVYPGASYEANRLVALAGIVGLLVGWRGLGTKIRFEERTATALGIRSGVSAYLWVVFVLGLNEMLEGMLRNRYFEPIDAILTVPAEMLEYIRLSIHPMIIGSVLVLSAIGGIIAKRTGNRWS